MKRVTLTVALAAACAVENLAPAVHDFALPKLLRARRELAGSYYNLTVQIVMRDGVTLNTLICVPSDASEQRRVGTVLARTPYGSSAQFDDLIAYCELGFAGVAQDARGRYESGGNWSFWRTAAVDGEDSFKWLASQHWSNGRFATTGVSAPGVDSYDQALAPNGAYPGLAAQVNYVSTGLLHPAAYQGGAYRESLISGWLNQSIGEAWYIPQVMAHEGWSQWWNSTTLGSATTSPPSVPFSAVSYPVIHAGGFYDIFSSKQIETYQGILAANRSGVAEYQWLIMNPGGHCSGGGAIAWPNATWGWEVAEYLGLFLYEAELNTTLSEHARSALLQSSSAARQAARMLAGAAASSVAADAPRVILYVLGPGTFLSSGNFWAELPALPVPMPTPLYLWPNSLLMPNGPPPTEEVATYLSDPARPVPTFGGNNLLITCGPQNQAELEELFAAAMAVFTSEAAPEDLVMCGLIQAELAVSVTSVDADVAVSVKDVFPTGESMLLQDGIVRLRWREGPFATKPTLVTPGQIYNVTVDVGHMCYVLNTGHKLRVTIQGSNAPRFSVNPQNGAPLSDNTTAPVAAQASVHYGPSHPSRLILPLVKASAMLGAAIW